MAQLDSEQEALVDWAVLQLQGSEGKCQRTRLGVKDFSTQVKTGNFDIQCLFWHRDLAKQVTLKECLSNTAFLTA